MLCAAARVLGGMTEPKICAACNDKEAPVQGWHCCKLDGCKKPVHSHVLCDRVWMPENGT